MSGEQAAHPSEISGLLVGGFKHVFSIYWEY